MDVYKNFYNPGVLKKNILAANTIYVCIFHNDNILKKYFVELEKIFRKIKQAREKKIKLNH